MSGQQLTGGEDQRQGQQGQPEGAPHTPGKSSISGAILNGLSDDGAEFVEPLYVKQLGEANSGYNHSNPTWTRDGSLLGFERNDEKNREIIIADNNGTIVQTVKHMSQEADDLDLGLLLPGFEEKISYNAGITWSPDGSKYIYMSNGDEGNYDLYMGELGQTTVSRLTDDQEKDGHASWSPTGREVAFISGRNGGANIYFYDTKSQDIAQLSNDKHPYLYPEWAPSGDKLAVIYGTNENHDIYIYENFSDGLNNSQRRALIKWNYDDLRPVWSPDGGKIAFYTNYNEENDPKVWSLVVLDANAPVLENVEEVVPYILATNIVPDVNKGPTWLPDSTGLLFVKNDRDEYNPIEKVDIETRKIKRIATNTKINHDVSCSTTGVIAFRAQVDQWDQIFLAKLPEFGEGKTSTIGDL